MARIVPLVLIAVLALAGWITLSRERVSPDQRAAAAAAQAWLQAAANTDARGLCATEAPPEGFAGSVATAGGVARGAWAQVCPKTHDTSALASKVPTFRAAATAGPSSTVSWANGAQMRVNFADQNLAIYAVRQPEGWRVLSDADLPGSAS